MSWHRIITISFPSIVAVLYAATGFSFLCRREWAWATVWLCYAVANVGLVLSGSK